MLSRSMTCQTWILDQRITTAEGDPKDPLREDHRRLPSPSDRIRRLAQGRALLDATPQRLLQAVAVCGQMSLKGVRSPGKGRLPPPLVLMEDKDSRLRPQGPTEGGVQLARVREGQARRQASRDLFDLSRQVCLPKASTLGKGHQARGSATCTQRTKARHFRTPGVYDSHNRIRIRV